MYPSILLWFSPVSPSLSYLQVLVWQWKMSHQDKSHCIYLGISRTTYPSNNLSVIQTFRTLFSFIYNKLKQKGLMAEGCLKLWPLLSQHAQPIVTIVVLLWLLSHVVNRVNWLFHSGYSEFIMKLSIKVMWSLCLSFFRIGWLQNFKKRWNIKKEILTLRVIPQMSN